MKHTAATKSRGSILLCVLCFFCSVPVFFAQTGSIQGSVVRDASMEPLSKARVELRNEDGSTVFDSTTTETDGRFLFQNVMPGRYRLVVTRQGYVRPPWMITIAAGESLSGIQLPMTATGAIYGRVFDSKGQPYGNIVLRALKAAYPQGQRVLTPVQSVTTNDLGEYRLFWLQPGRYFVVAMPPETEPPEVSMVRLGGFGVTGLGDSKSSLFIASADNDPATLPETARDPLGAESNPDRHVPVYFPGTTDEQAASAINVRGGTDSGGVDIVITPVRERHVRGVIIEGATGRPPAFPSLNILGDVVSPLRPRAALAVNRDTGAFDILLLPGTYTLVAGSANGNGYASVRVGETDVENVTIFTTRGFNIRGHIRVEGRDASSTDLGSLRISIRRDAPRFRAQPSSYSTPLADGSFTLDAGLGDFRIHIAPILDVAPDLPIRLPSTVQDLYVKSIRLGNNDVLNDGLHLERPPADPLEIVLGANPGSLEGAVGVRDVSIVLLPDVRRRTDLYRMATSDSSGRFRFDRVPPGDYKIFAWAQVESGAWYDEEFMRDYEHRGQPVRVGEGSKQEIPVRVIQ